MDKKTAEALEKSIAKWKRNSRVRKPESYLVGTANCPLCHLFHTDKCEGCPVKERTGHRYCEGTPYDGAENASRRWDMFAGNPRLAKIARKIARDEVAFLESLRE